MRIYIFMMLSLLLCCCGSEATKTSQKIVVVGSQWYGHIPVWIGIEKGFFKESGFEVEWRPIGKSMDRLNAISSGRAHFASLGEIAMLSSMAFGNKNFYWVGNQDIAPGLEGMVAAPEINSLQDLKGKKIGFPFGTTVDITCRMLLKQQGLDPQKDVQLVNLEVGDVPAVFRAKNVDAAAIWEPGFSQLTAVEGATVLGKDTDTEVYQKFGTMTGPDVLIISKKWVDSHPQRAQKFLKCYFKALEWVKNNGEEAIKIIHNKYIQQDIGLIQKNMKIFKWHGLEEQRQIMSEKGIFRQADYILKILHEEMKVIPHKPAFREWVNLQVLPQE
ncbi:ABC transporter substrate-binding protein [Candidatus Uabimicrobium amorphum]|uniref:Taurine ABC transporter substrate-binding protein n=1 Tax=Uabimicrobium amorphum TaxID=2596890 RepID=A0A5S9ILM3_UABAM|nr:ABC transporter substrate-binding protein [Candidatus Uabimicrobium amorphum]BBM83310.1 taurine ABC transporter substrate-binding protein [Candidatus Uabimicrobium amorphum]